MSPVPPVGLSGTAGVSGVLAAGGLQGTAAAAAVQGPAEAGGFATAMAQGLEQVQSLQATADTLAVQAATGDLTNVHDYMIAATQAQLATELTVAIRNKAVQAFSEIMRMQA